MIELQSHSTVSDGELEPAGVVAEAARAGITTLALTDHDSVAGVPAAAAAAGVAGIELIPAVELSCVHDELDDLHMLGYWIDLDAMSDACARAQQGRIERAEAIIARLRALGVDVTLEGAIAEAGSADSIGRPHIARAAGATDMKAFFERYLVPGGEAFVARRWPHADEAVDLIRQAGGTPVVAHPFWDLDDPESVSRLVRSLDLDGVECFYPTHSRDEVRFLLDLCAELDLATTGSSDFHGPAHKTFPRFGAYDTFGLGEPEIPRPD